jgi:oxygen-independent coproporphyrinogen-3 oxidase
MCHFSTSWKEKSMQTPALYKGLELMSELIEDKLVIIENDSLKVTEEGRVFVRNICICLDARMLKDKPKTKIFSTTI